MSNSAFLEHCEIKDGVLTVNARSSEVTAAIATSVFEWVREHESFDSLLLHGSSEYKEPYYATVGPWIEGLIGSRIQNLQRFKIDGGTTMNRQFGNYIGDVTPILQSNTELKMLYLCGAFKCSNFSHNNLQQISIANCFIESEDLQILSKADLPELKSFALYDGDAGLSNAEFNTVLVDSLSKLNATKLADLYLCDWSVCDDFLKKIYQTPVISQLKLLHLDSFEFGYDPEESVDLLVSSCDKLRQIQELRIPFKGFMEDEITQLKEKIPKLENCRPESGSLPDPFSSMTL